jgi:hypothetical protein
MRQPLTAPPAYGRVLTELEGGAGPVSSEAYSGPPFLPEGPLSPVLLQYERPPGAAWLNYASPFTGATLDTT